MTGVLNCWNQIKNLAGVREDVHKRSITMLVDLGHYQRSPADDGNREIYSPGDGSEFSQNV